MKKNTILVQTLCLPYCHYYKPGRNEELLCRGAVVVQQLIESGRNLSVEEKPRHDLDFEAQEMVTKQVCGSCEFREQDCDFSRDRRARPCGGYGLISRLVLAGVITIEDIK